jgi:hypothetical protein
MHTVRIRRRTCLTVTLTVFTLSHLHAAAASAAPLLDLGDKLNEITTEITTYGRALTLLAVVLTFLYMLCEPALPQVARENKGLLGRVLMGAIGLGLAPDIVAFVFG